MVFGSFPNGEMDAMAVMEIVCDKVYFFGKGREVFCKNGNYLATKTTKKA